MLLTFSHGKLRYMDFSSSTKWEDKKVADLSHFFVRGEKEESICIENSIR
jgi:hypothetical protein